MRYLNPVFATCSGLVVATAGFNALTDMATAAQITPDTRIAAVGAGSQSNPAPKLKEVCSRNHPLQVSRDGTQLALAQGTQQPNLVSSIVQMFCRDVRINTIVVRDYCAVIRE
jgi:hypothetical protein